MNVRGIIFFFFFLGFSVLQDSGLAKENPLKHGLFESEETYASLQSIYNLENITKPFNESNAYLRDFYSIQQLWWMHLCGDQQAYKKLDKMYLQHVEKNTDPKSKFLCLMAGGYLLRMTAMGHSPFQSAERYFALLPHLKYILERADQCPEYRLFYGLYHAGLGSQNGFIQISLSGTLPKPRKEEGLRVLNDLKKHTKTFAGNESTYFLYKLEGLVEDELRIKYLDELIKAYPKNIVYKLERLKLPHPSTHLMSETKKLIKENEQLHTEHKNHLLAVCSQIEYSKSQK